MLPKWKLIEAAVCPATPAILAEVTADKPCREIAATVAWIRSSLEPLGRPSVLGSRLAAMLASSADATHSIPLCPVDSTLIQFTKYRFSHA